MIKLPQLFGLAASAMVLSFFMADGSASKNLETMEDPETPKRLQTLYEITEGKMFTPEVIKIINRPVILRKRNELVQKITEEETDRVQQRKEPLEERLLEINGTKEKINKHKKVVESFLNSKQKTSNNKELAGAVVYLLKLNPKKETDIYLKGTTGKQLKAAHKAAVDTINQLNSEISKLKKQIANIELELQNCQENTEIWSRNSQFEGNALWKYCGIQMIQADKPSDPEKSSKEFLKYFMDLNENDPMRDTLVGYYSAHFSPSDREQLFLITRKKLDNLKIYVQQKENHKTIQICLQQITDFKKLLDEEYVQFKAVDLISAVARFLNLDTNRMGCVEIGSDFLAIFLGNKTLTVLKFPDGVKYNDFYDEFGATGVFDNQINEENTLRKLDPDEVGDPNSMEAEHVCARFFQNGLRLEENRLVTHIITRTLENGTVIEFFDNSDENESDENELDRRLNDLKENKGVSSEVRSLDSNKQNIIQIYYRDGSIINIHTPDNEDYKNTENDDDDDVEQENNWWDLL